MEWDVLYCTAQSSGCCGCVWALPVDLSKSICTPLFQTPRTLASTRTQPTSSCAWQEKTGRWPTPRPGSTRTPTSQSASRTGGRFWPRRASTWGDTTLRPTLAARARTWVSPTRASTARAMRATAVSQGTTSPGVCSGTAAPSQPGTVTWKHLWTRRSSPVSGFTWTTVEAYWLSMVWMKPWRSSTSTRPNFWSLSTQRSGSRRRRTLWRWWHLGNHYGSKAHPLPPHLQALLLSPKLHRRNGERQLLDQ